MRYPRALVAASCLALGFPRSVHGQIAHPLQFVLGGGASFLVGDDRKFYHDGYNVQAGFSMATPNPQLSVDATVFYHGFKGKGVSDQVVAGAPDTLRLGDFSVLAGTIGARWRLTDAARSASRLVPYLAFGGGVYRIESEAQLYGQHVSGADTRAGITTGLGLSFPLGASTGFVEARVHKVFVSGGSSNLYPLTFGVRF